MIRVSKLRSKKGVLPINHRNQLFYLHSVDAVVEKREQLHKIFFTFIFFQGE